MSDITTVKDLEKLRALTLHTNALHELQVQHLKLWFLGCFESVQPKQMDIAVDFDNREVIYKIQKKKPAKSEAKCQTIAAWIQWLLGDWWSVGFEFNDKLAYRFVAKSPPPKSIAADIRASLKVQPSASREDEYGG